MTVKNGKLLFIRAAGAVSASGKPLPPVTITRQSGDSHRFSISDRETYTGVRALYNDIRRAVKGEETVGKSEWSSEHAEGGGPSTIQPSAENVKTLRHVYASKENAKRAATAEWQRLQRGVATFPITLCRGNPELFPELPATVRGWKPAIDNTDWILTRVIHTLGDGGFTTAVELEIRAAEIPG